MQPKKSRVSVRKIILIGCGIHYREKYHSVLQKKGVLIVLMIDLKANQAIIEEFLDQQRLKPKQLLFLDEVYRNGISLETLEHLVADTDLSQVDGVLISTEPKARKSYALWAARNGWDIFMDKPVTAFPSLEESNCLETDFAEILSEVKSAKVNAVVSCERRAHLGYIWLKQHLKCFIEKERVPLTSVDIHFAGGVWKTPAEYHIDENHPFRYGYGILLHSGYHYIDLLLNILALNEPLSYTLSVLGSPPSGLRYGYEGFGEVDFLMIGQAFNKGGSTTHFSVQLFGTSVSLRRNQASTHKLAGRVRQEKLTLHLGHFSSIHLTSLPFKKFDPQKYSEEDFNITILNSPLLSDQPAITALDRAKISTLFPQLPLDTNMNSYARQWQLEEFLEGRDGNSSLGSHYDTTKMLQKIYTLLRENQLSPI